MRIEKERKIRQKGALGTDILSTRHFSSTAASPADQTGRVGKRISLRRFHRAADAPEQMVIWLNRVIWGVSRSGKKGKGPFWLSRSKREVKKTKLKTKTLLFRV
jgi:hypothetical protein